MSLQERVRTSRKLLTEEEIKRRMTPADLDNARDLILFLATERELNIDGSAQLLLKIEEFIQPLRQGSAKLQQQLEERRLSRRKLFGVIRTGAIWTIVGTGSAGVLYWGADQWFGPSAQKRWAEKDLARRKKLEEHNLLGLEKSIASFSGWTVRYAEKRTDLKFVTTNVTSGPLSEGTWVKLPGNKLNELENTGIIIEEHIRTQDGKAVGKLAIVTKFIPKASSAASDTIEIGEEFVLRDEPTEGVNVEILIFENQLNGAVQYLSLTRSKALDSQNPTFQLRAYKL